MTNQTNDEPDEPRTMNNRIPNDESDVFLWSNTSEFGRNSSIIGRTDLRKGVSEAKFDVEVAGDVKNSLSPPKFAENHEKPEICSKKFRKYFFDVEKSKVPKRVFPKFRADWSQVRGANGRSKFEFVWWNTNFYQVTIRNVYGLNIMITVVLGVFQFRNYDHFLFKVMHGP